MPFSDAPFDQSVLIAALQRPDGYPHPVTTVEHRQTHISHVLLAGDYAYKIKKPVNLGFLDFTSLARRYNDCVQEVRLNRRLAPHLYLDCVPIGGHQEHPVWDSEPAIEYAVRMRRFPQEALLDQVLAAGRLEPRHVDRLARQLADFQRTIPVADGATPFGTPAQIQQPMLDNFTHTRSRLNDPADLAMLAEVERWTRHAAVQFQSQLLERKAGGWIREGHGDLHLGNMILADNDQITIFDCITFNDALRWIDVVNDLAFLTMDLRVRGAGHFAQRLLNTWLEYSGDFAGMALLSYYQVYRAMVRVKVNAMAAEMAVADGATARERCRDYLRLAVALTREPAPFLLITHGVSGSGKSHRTGQLLEVLPGALRIRADVERKRLFGLSPLDNSRACLNQDLYTAEASARTYQRLLELADLLLTARHPVLVDATFMKQAHREPFRALAARHKVPFILLHCGADADTLRQRVAARWERGDDPAEADVAVLERQLRVVEPPMPDEQALNAGDDDDLATLQRTILAYVATTSGQNPLAQGSS